MSLIYWWPFTDNTVDKINGKTFTSTNWSFQSGGKIGNCFTPSWTDSNTISRQIYAESVSIPETFSVAVWVKNNNNFNSPRTYCPIQFSNGDCWLTGASNKGWDFSHESLRLIFNNGSNVSGNAGNAEVNWGYNPREFLGNWYHIAFTVNKVTRKAELFINGISKGVRDLPSAVTTYGGTFKLKLNWVQGWMLDGSLNDLRIYNHALSKKEVQQLSKALVLHYTFDAPPHEQELVGAGINQWSNASYYTYDGSGTTQGSYYMEPDGSVRCVDNVTNSRFQYMVQPSMQQGDTFEVSIRYKQLTGGQAFRWQIQELNAEGTIVHTWWSVGGSEAQQEFLETDGWKLIKYIFTVSNAATAKARFWIQGGEDYIKYTRSFQLKDFKIHKIANRIGDSSGLGNSGALYLPQYYKYSHDSVLGTGGLHCTGETNSGPMHIDTKLNPSFISGTGTVCVWYKKDPVALESQYNNGNFILATPDRSKEYGWLAATSAGSAPTNNNNCSWTKWYYDGVEQNESNTKDTNWHFYCATGVDLSNWTTFQIHSHGDKDWLYRGVIADYRVYNTVLSADDVAELYKTRWSANSAGQVFSCAINEGQEKFQITKGGVNNCNTLNETGNLPSGYMPLQYIQSSGAQSINTNYLATENTRTIFDYEYLNSSASWAGLFGSDNYPTNSDMGYGLFLNGSTYGCYVSNHTTGNCWNQEVGTWIQNQRTLLDFTHSKLIINNAAYNLRTTTFATSLVPIYLFAFRRSTGNAGVSSIRLYNCQIWERTTLVRNFIPAKRAVDGVLGLYDTVNNVFYTNSGSGNFIAGPMAVSQSRNGSLYCAEFNET